MEACGADIPQPQGADVFIAVMGEDAKKAGLRLLKELREKGLKAQMDIMGRNIKNQFKYADRIKAKKTVIIGQDELESGAYAVKDMATAQQVMIPASDIAKELLK